MMRKRWDGAFVDDKCFEMRHPQDYVRGVKDNPSIPISRLRIVDVVDSTLASSITAADVTMVVATGEGAMFPSTYPFYCALQSATQANLEELVKVTLRVTDTFTIERGFAGSIPTARDAADLVILTSAPHTVSL